MFVQAIDDAQGLVSKGMVRKELLLAHRRPEALLLAKGEAGMAPNGTFSFDNMVAAFKQTGQELGVAPFPSLRDGVPYPLYAVGTGSTMSINKSSANPEGAGSSLITFTPTSSTTASARTGRATGTSRLPRLARRNS